MMLPIPLAYAHRMSGDLSFLLLKKPLYAEGCAEEKDCGEDGFVTGLEEMG